MDTSLVADLRTETGKGAARKLRSSGKIPAVLYGKGQSARSISIDPHRVDEIFRKTKDRNTLLEIKLGNDTARAMVKDTQRHPISRKIEHIDFYELHEDTVVEVMVPLRGVGRPAGASVGGILQLLRRDVKVRARFDKIPASIDYDIRPLNVGDIRKASDIPLPEGVELVFKSDFNALRIIAKRGSKT